MVAVLSRIFGLNQIEIIMDVVQDTFESALKKWKFSGIPENPSAWLMTVARNKALNTIKREARSISLSTSKNDLEHAVPDSSFDIIDSEKQVTDSQLYLLLSCCQPEISSKNQVIITLHVLCGFGVPEIANGLLMKDEAVKKALTRSKLLLRKSKNIFEAPLNSKLIEKGETIQTILYLIFNEGYKTTRAKDGISHDLCYEAIRLTRLIHQSNHLCFEASALLALMFFNLSRFPARVTDEGEWLTIEEQDRTLWNKTFIEEGFHYLKLATQSGILSRLHLEAIISSIHCAAASFEETDWGKIVFLHRQLEILEPDSPVISLNRIIAESYINNSESLINEIVALESHFSSDKKSLLYAAKGDLYKRMRKVKDAQNAFRTAIEYSRSPMDTNFLYRRMHQCSE